MGKGFKHGAGGCGDALGITIVPGATKPTAPKDNTIWANSKNSMGSWAISPTEPHRVSINKNLIVYPYAFSTNSKNGVTVIVDSSSSNKGKVTVNGTNTYNGSLAFRLSEGGPEKGEMILQPGTYCLRGNCSSSSSTTHRLLIGYSYDNWGKTTTASELENGGVFTIDKVAKARVSIQVSKGASANNAVYSPMLVKGSTPAAYTVGNATGQIWVKTDTTGNISMDALKGANVLTLNPVAVYEYTTNNGWVERNAEVYQYGAWTELKPAWDGYYFKDGNQYTDVTGGWTKDGWGGTGSVTVGSTLVATGTGGEAVVGTANPVDLSNVSKVWIDSPNGNNGYGFGYMFIAKSKSVASSESVAYVQVTKAGSFSIDVSGLSGKYYIYLYAGDRAYVDARAIWKE